jgi:hypothetical protein
VPPIELWTVVRRVRDVFGGFGGGALAALVSDQRRHPRDAPDPAGRVDRSASRDALLGQLPPEAAEAAADTTPAGRPILTTHRLIRASATLAALAPANVERLRALLAQHSRPLRAYLLCALSAGHPPARLERLAADVAPYGGDDGWVHRHLGLLDGGIGRATFVDDAGGEFLLRQLAPVTCGPTSLIVLRAITDPVYALALTTGGTPGDPARSSARAVEERFRDQQRVVHHAATRGAIGPLPWPKRFGTPPWGAARLLNQLSWTTGVEYRWQPVDNTDPAQLRDRLAAITAGVAAGIPVPLYIGRHVDRHVVLAFGYEDGELHLYEPSHGAVVAVTGKDVVANRMDSAGWPRLEGVLIPRPVARK